MSGSDEAPGGGPNQRPPAPSYPPSFNRPPRPWARPPGRGQLRPPTVDPFARPQQYPTHHYHPYGQPSGSGRGSQQTGYPPQQTYPAPSTSSQGYSYQNLNVAGPSASYTPAQISQPLPYYSPHIPPPVPHSVPSTSNQFQYPNIAGPSATYHPQQISAAASHAEPIDELGEQRIPVIATHPERRAPAEPFYAKIDEEYKVKQVTGFPYSSFMIPGEQSIPVIVTDRREYQESPVNMATPEGMKELPKRPAASETVIPGPISGLMPRALRDQVDSRLSIALELFKKKMNNSFMAKLIWDESRDLIKSNLNNYFKFICKQQDVLRYAFNYDILKRVQTIRAILDEQHRRYWMVHNDRIFEARQLVENMISDLEWHNSAHEIIMHNIYHARSLLGLSGPTEFSEDPSSANMFPE